MTADVDSLCNFCLSSGHWKSRLHCFSCFDRTPTYDIQYIHTLDCSLIYSVHCPVVHRVQQATDNTLTGSGREDATCRISKDLQNVNNL